MSNPRIPIVQFFLIRMSDVLHGHVGYMGFGTKFMSCSDSEVLFLCSQHTYVYEPKANTKYRYCNIHIKLIGLLCNKNM
jgi:hypothetical protein